MAEEKNKLSLTGLEVPLVLAIIALFYWHSPVLLPIKLLTVFFHELSHAIATLLTGGQVHGIDLNLNQGGATYIVGGWRLVSLSAGYLGSLLWGAGILLLSLKKGINRYISVAIGLLMIIVTLVWIRTLQALSITLLTAGALIFIAYKLNEEYCSIIIKFISLVSCFYVIFDIKDDLLDRTVNGSDASQMAKMIFPAFMQSAGSYIIGLLWFGIAIFVLWKVFKYALNPNRK